MVYSSVQNKTAPCFNFLLSLDPAPSLHKYIFSLYLSFTLKSTECFTFYHENTLGMVSIEVPYSYGKGHLVSHGIPSQTKWILSEEGSLWYPFFFAKTPSIGINEISINSHLAQLEMTGTSPKTTMSGSCPYLYLLSFFSIFLFFSFF